MATAATFRTIARRLESEVERRGCGRASCYCQDVEEALAPPERPASRTASARRTGEYPALPDGIDAQDAATFAGQLYCY